MGFEVRKSSGNLVDAGRRTHDKDATDEGTTHQGEHGGHRDKQHRRMVKDEYEPTQSLSFTSFRVPVEYSFFARLRVLRALWLLPPSAFSSKLAVEI